MQLEKLDLLEERLGQFIARYRKLLEENNSLKQALEAESLRVKELEAEAGSTRTERERFKTKLDRIINVVEQLELLQEQETGEAE